VAEGLFWTSDVTNYWRKLHYEELRDMYYSSNFIRVIKSRRMKWVEPGANVGEKRKTSRASF
jgi:hypothetical protein